MFTLIVVHTYHIIMEIGKFLTTEEEYCSAIKKDWLKRQNAIKKKRKEFLALPEVKMLMRARDSLAREVEKAIKTEDGDKINRAAKDYSPINDILIQLQIQYGLRPN